MEVVLYAALKRAFNVSYILSYLPKLKPSCLMFLCNLKQRNLYNFKKGFLSSIIQLYNAIDKKFNLFNLQKLFIP